jgi:chromosome partitioning protein
VGQPFAGHPASAHPISGRPASDQTTEATQATQATQAGQGGQAGQAGQIAPASPGPLETDSDPSLRIYPSGRTAAAAQRSQRRRHLSRQRAARRQAPNVGAPDGVSTNGVSPHGGAPDSPEPDSAEPDGAQHGGEPAPLTVDPRLETRPSVEASITLDDTTTVEDQEDFAGLAVLAERRRAGSVVTSEEPTTGGPSRPFGLRLPQTPDDMPHTPSSNSLVHPASRRPLPRIFAVANQKGGVGKTTTAVNLGAALAELGYRVLVIDLDPQGNATTGLGVNAHNLEHSVYDGLLHDVPMEDIVEATSLRNLFVVPATIDLAGAEIELVPVFSRELRLRRSIQTVRDEFDYFLIDCPPSLGLLTVNGLAAADEVLVPIQCEYYALEGVGQLLRNVNLVRSNLNTQLELTTIIMTMYDARTKLAEQVVTEVRNHFGDVVCRNIVPRTVRLSEAPSFGQPIIVFDPSSRGATAYRELAKEVSGGAPQRTR